MALACCHTSDLFYRTRAYFTTLLVLTFVSQKVPSFNFKMLENMFHQEAVSNTALVFGWVIFAKFNKAEEIWRQDRKKKTNERRKERRKESSLFLERPKLFASFNGRHVGAVPMPAFALPHSACLPYRLLLLLLHICRGLRLSQ